MDRFFATRSGTSVRLTMGEFRPVKNEDAVATVVEVRSAGTRRPVRVVFETPGLISTALQHADQDPLTSEAREELAALAVLHAIDEDPELLGDTDDPYDLRITPSEAVSLRGPEPLSDRDFRRYIARRVYHEYSRDSMDVSVAFDSYDHKLTGGSQRDFLRNSQVLEQEGYLTLDRTLAGDFDVRPTSRLVREVERFGAAAEDAASDPDFQERLSVSRLPNESVSAIADEHQRYSLARTPAELRSVFRAVAPMVEDLLRDVLRAEGVKRELPSLGVMIGELKNRGLVTLDILSQLNHVLKFARDLEQHGVALPEPVLRIACVNAFELIPQLATLRSGDSSGGGHGG